LATANAGPVAPADLSAEFALRGAEASLQGLAGTVAGARISGNLAWLRPAPPVDFTGLDVDLALARSIAGDAPTATPAQISGNVSVDRATLGSLLALPLGAPAKTAARWSDAPFAEPLFKPPSTDVRLRIGALDVWDGLPAQNLAARLQMDAGKFDLDEIAVDVAGGRASGRLTLRRDGPVAALEGKIELASIGFDRPALRGRLGVSLALAGAGKSPSALVAGLVGEGQATLAGASVPRLDPGALGRVMEKAEAPDAPIDETNVARALTLELDRRSLAIPDGAIAAALNSGVLRIGPLAIGEPSGRATISGDFDLRSWNLQIRTAFEEARAGKFWSGSRPSASITIRGAWDAPTRQIDVASLVAGLATQAIARESERIAGLEADMRERAFFNRVLKSGRFLSGRAAEIAAYQAEQTRLKSEADRERVEASLLKAYADQTRAKTSDPVPAIDAAPAVNGARSKPSSEAEVDRKAAAPKAAPAVPSAPPDPTAGGLY
jgi:AsmA-like C-terminal region